MGKKNRKKKAQANDHAGFRRKETNEDVKSHKWSIWEKKNKTENTEKAKNTMVLILEELCILNVAGKFVHYVCLSISKDPISVSVCISGRMFPILCEKL